MIYKPLHKKQKIEQHEPHKYLNVNSDAPEESTVSVSLVAPSCYSCFLYYLNQFNKTNI